MTDENPEMSDNFPTVTAEAEKRIRNAERHKIAYLLEQRGDTLVGYLSDPKDAARGSRTCCGWRRTAIV